MMMAMLAMLGQPDARAPKPASARQTIYETFR
jgi:hypothetical protein